MFCIGACAHTQKIREISADEQNKQFPHQRTKWSLDNLNILHTEYFPGWSQLRRILSKQLNRSVNVIVYRIMRRTIFSVIQHGTEKDWIPLISWFVWSEKNMLIQNRQCAKSKCKRVFLKNLLHFYHWNRKFESNFHSSFQQIRNERRFFSCMICEVLINKTKRMLDEFQSN